MDVTAVGSPSSRPGQAPERPAVAGGLDFSDLLASALARADAELPPAAKAVEPPVERRDAALPERPVQARDGREPKKSAAADEFPGATAQPAPVQTEAGSVQAKAEPAPAEQPAPAPVAAVVPVQQPAQPQAPEPPQPGLAAAPPAAATPAEAPAEAPAVAPQSAAQQPGPVAALAPPADQAAAPQPAAAAPKAPVQLPEAAAAVPGSARPAAAAEVAAEPAGTATPVAAQTAQAAELARGLGAGDRVKIKTATATTAADTAAKPAGEPAVALQPEAAAAPAAEEAEALAEQPAAPKSAEAANAEVKAEVKAHGVERALERLEEAGVLDRWAAEKAATPKPFAAVLEQPAPAAARATASAAANAVAAPVAAVGNAAASAAAKPSMADAKASPAVRSALADVGLHIRNAAAAGKDRISIHLRPESLGKVDVKLEFGPDRQVSVAVVADSREALEALQRDVRGLERALQDLGLKADSGSMSFDLRDHGQPQQGAERPAGKGYPVRQAAEEDAGPTLRPAAGNRRAGTGGIDISI